ncbi:hypothetical protein LINPERHAP2_LOCUS31882 [Linum perenne]
MQDDALSNPRCPRIAFSDEEIRSFYKPWSKALVVKVLERSFSYMAMKRRLETLWARSGKIQVADLANNFFLVRFSEAEDYEHALTGGPWKIYDYYISVARWSPSFNESEPIRTLMTWVRLPKLPIQYFNNLAVTRIGNYIGKTVRLDLATAEGARGRYARVCVEVDLSKPLLGKYMLEDRVFFVEYESIENFCFGCGSYGYKAENCPICRPVDLSKAPETQPATDSAQPAEDGDTGSWMTVGRRQKKTPAKQPSPESGGSGSRFTVLTQVEAQAEGPSQRNSEKGSDETTTPVMPISSSYHAKALARVLEKAFQPEKIDSAQEKTKTKPREPLSDVTNQQRKATKNKNESKLNKEVAAKSNKAKGTEAEKQHVSPASSSTMYQNPIFQSESKALPSVSGAFARIRNRLEKVSNAKSAPKTLPKVKKFKAKGRQPIANGTHPEASVVDEITGSQPRPEEPPDHSC